MSTIQDQLAEYLELNKQQETLRQKQKDLKERATELECAIKDYMAKHEMDTISLSGGEIVLYKKRVPQTFKKEVMIETLTETLQNRPQAERLANTILQNKKFIEENKIRVVLKKQSKR